MAQPKIQFYKGTTAPDVATYKMGTIWFDKTNRVLKVRIAETGEASDWEQYAGKLDDIRLEKTGVKAGYLIVTKADGTNIEVNLNDIASAGSVAAAIQNLQEQINGLGSRVGTLEGKVDVDKVSTAISGAVSTAIGDLNADKTGTSADSKVSVQVTEASGKITAVAVTTDDIASASDLSGVSSRVGTLEGKVGEDSVADQISSAIGDLNADKTSESVDGKVSVQVTEAAGKITAVKVTTDDIASASEVAGEISGLKQADQNFTTELNTLKTKVDSFGSPLRFRGVTDTAPTTDLKEGDFYITKAGVEYIYAKTGANEALQWEKVGDTSTEAQQIADALSRIGTLEGKVDVDKVSTAISGAIGDLNATKEGSSADSKVTVKVTEAAGKITAVKVTTDDIASASDLSGVSSRVGTLEGKVDVAKVSEAISDAIADLDATVDSTGGAKVAVKVTETDGKVTAVKVTETDIASASDLNNAVSRIAAVETQLTWGGFN